MEHFLIVVLCACFFLAAVSPVCKNSRRMIDTPDNRID